MRRVCCGWMVLLSAWVTGCESDGGNPSAPPVASGSPVERGGQSAEADANVFRVKFETTQGDFVVEVHPDWSPNGAAHFRKLVEARFYDGCAFFRVVDGFMAQFGINGDPKVHAQWADQNIPDDPVKQSNTRGMVTFAMTGLPNSRSTQLFINFGDNSFLDAQRFAPFGKVVDDGMKVVDALYKGYGEGAPQGNGPDQMAVRNQGNAYLKANFPKLDYIKKAYIVGANEADSPSEATPETTPESSDAAPTETPESPPE